jgi:hypothetical protein
MSIYDWYKYREEPSAAEQSRQEMNRRLYGIVAGDILEETEEDQKNFSKFFQDLAVYSTFYEKRDPTTFGKAIAEERIREEEEKQREGAVRFIDQLVDLGGGITPRGRELRDELGLAAPIIGIDYETGNIAYTNLDQQQAEDRIAYTAENQLSLFGTEAASIYGVTRKYTGGANIFRSLEQQAPSLFQQPTEKEQEFIKRSLTFQGSWDRTLDILPFVNTRTAGSEDVDTNVWFLENVRAWFDASILPTEALGGKKQEGWDGSKAWGVLQEYHPDFASYLVTIAGVNPDDLAKTPNHWEFRYAVNNAIEMSNIYAVLENARRDRNNWEGALNFGWNFLKQSFRSADMPLELALTAASFGAYGAVGIGTIGLRGTKALSLAKSSYDATQLIRNTERLATATSRTNRILSGARTTQALLVPSNWGHILTSSIFNRKLATEGVRWGSNYNWGSRFMLMAPIDAGQGLVEGFLYGLQNQLTDNLSFSGERLWMETWSEAAGQMVFGKLFRGLNQSAGIVLSKAEVGSYGSAVWGAVTKNINPSLVRMIELQAQLNNPELNIDQIEQAYLGAFLQLHQHAAWQGITGDKRGMMPAHVTQFMGVVQSAAKQKGVNIDVVSLAAGVYDSLPVDSDTGEKVKLTEDEAAMLLIGSTLDQLSSRGLTLTDSDWTETNKQAAIYFLMSDKMAEMGISKEEQARMIVENPKEYRKKMKEAYAEILTSDPKIVSQKVEELAEIGRSAVEKAGIPIKIIVDDSKAQAVSIIDAFRDEMGNIDTALLREIFENSRAKELNISPETVRLVLDFARSEEARAASEEVTEVPEESGDTVLEGEPTTKPIEEVAVEPEMQVEETEVTAPEEVRDTPAVEPAETPEVTTTTNLEETINPTDNNDREQFLNSLRDDPEFRDCFKK